MPKICLCIFILTLPLGTGAQQLSPEALLDFVNTRYQAYRLR